MDRDDEKDESDWQPPTYATLTTEQRKALRDAMCCMLDTYMDELNNSSSSFQFDDTLMSEVVPPRYVDQYDYHFAVKLLVAFMAAMERIRNTELPRSLAEEMCVWAIFDHAVSMVEDLESRDEQSAEDIVSGLEDFRDEFFEDTDFRFLWDGRFDGAEYLDSLRPANLRFGDWFKSFREERPVNPYLEGEA